MTAGVRMLIAIATAAAKVHEQQSRIPANKTPGATTAEREQGRRPRRSPRSRSPRRDRWLRLLAPACPASALGSAGLRRCHGDAAPRPTGAAPACAPRPAPAPPRPGGPARGGLLDAWSRKKALVVGWFPRISPLANRRSRIRLTIWITERDWNSETYSTSLGKS
ncbi:translation initiation factor IF-2-like isoform X1 [Equus quagga]|uniref:translation initiation factor IF-2-like isoform X1 n=2 Tax=Equus quagga TaxID=89248 RepID=UPI001EE27260|nr:translation initiation factor IF-2-like isoform X1 [Equus quagga]